MILILEQIGIGLLGMLIYNVWKFSDFLKSKQHMTKVFWSSLWDKYKFKYLWTFVMLILISITIVILPDSAPAITKITALNVGTQLVAFLTLGAGLSSFVDTEKEK
jgi:hypothetical protein